MKGETKEALMVGVQALICVMIALIVTASLLALVSGLPEKRCSVCHSHNIRVYREATTLLSGNDKFYCYQCGREYSAALLERTTDGFQDGATFAYNKANEWHYVKDGDLPKEDIYLVIRLNDANTCYKCCTGFWDKEERCFHTLFCDKVDTKDIIAWKEIVLPEEIAE